MQMFGIGVLELLVILLLTVLVVGPDRMPQVAADLARWIRQGRAYARHLMGDFNQVVGELQKEANVSQEDWKEIANVVSRNTGEVGKELTRAAHDVEDAGDLALAKAEEEPVATASKNGNGANGSTPQEAEAKSEEEAEPAEETPAEDKPWYEPEKTPRASRRRRSTE
jgi:sec-independent protein translocase protein TatB